MPRYALGDREPLVDPTAFVHPEAVLIGEVVIGPEASVWPGVVLRGDMLAIEIGARTSIQDGSVLHTAEEWPTIIGADCIVGHIAHLEGCVVEDRCLIGSGSIVLNRAVVRTGALVGAGALVPEDTEVPTGHAALGVPARAQRMPDGFIERLVDYGVSEYLKLVHRYGTELRRID